MENVIGRPKFARKPSSCWGGGEMNILLKFDVSSKTEIGGGTKGTSYPSNQVVHLEIESDIQKQKGLICEVFFFEIHEQ